jgi:cytochrome P450
MQSAVSGGRPDAGGIEAPPATEPDVSGKTDRFDPAQLEDARFKATAIEYVARYPQWLIGLGRWLRPVIKVPFVRWAFVLRYDEVREVLTHDREFPVGWGDRMVEVTKGKNFVLGMPYDDEYRLSYEQLAEAFPRADVPRHVESQALAASAAILASKLIGENFDAVEELITAVPTHLCESYYGIQIADKILFAKWTLAISSYLFGPTPNEDDRKLALTAAACLRKTIRDSIASAKADPHQGIGIVLPRMIAMQEEDPQVTDDVIHAQLFGMVLGFIPTNVLAGGNILETLLSRPGFLKRTRAAALAGDDDLLWRCLRETLRFRHINLGPWRKCPNGYTFGEGGFCPIKVPPGYKVAAMFQSAMFDSRRVVRAHSFDPDRRDEDYMVFGIGQHWCLGAYIATAQLTQTFKLLLTRGDLQAVDGKAGRMKRFGIFPLHLNVRLGFKS